MARAFLTPEAEEGGLYLAPFFVPFGTDWEAIPRGLLVELLKEYNYEQGAGGQTVEHTVEVYQDDLARTFAHWTLAQPYYARLALLKPQSVIAHWPLWEPTGAVAALELAARLNGAVAGAAFGATGPGDGHTALSFDGTGDYCNVYSTGLDAVFPTARGTLTGWLKATSGMWADGIARYVARLRTVTNSYIRLYKPTGGGLVFEAAPGGTAIYVTHATTSLSWFHFALAWDNTAGEILAYIDGAQVGYTPGGTGVWAGALSSATCCIGAGQNNGANCWNGAIARVSLFNEVLSPREIAYLAKI